jgi:hypothetical protein
VNAKAPPIPAAIAIDNIISLIFFIPEEFKDVKNAISHEDIGKHALGKGEYS